MYITRSIVNKPLIALVDLLDNEDVQVLKGYEFYVDTFGEKKSLCICNGCHFWVNNWFLGLAFKNQQVQFKVRATYKMDVTHSTPSFESKSEAPTPAIFWNDFKSRQRKFGGLER